MHMCCVVAVAKIKAVSINIYHLLSALHFLPEIVLASDKELFIDMVNMSVV